MKAKELKREEANGRQAIREARGTVGQLERLEANGHGNCKEAKRLRAEIEGTK